MKLENISIRNFKSLSSFDLEPKRVNAIIGKNGSGKTSLLEAVRYLLSGECPNQAVTSGEDRATVEGNFLGVNVMRGTGDKTITKLNGKNTTQKSISQLMESILNCSMDTVRLATSANALGSMNAGQLSEYLVSNNLIPINVDLDTLHSLCPISEEAKLEMAMLFPPVPAVFGMDAIDDAYSHFFASRTVLKNSLKEKTIEAKFDGPIPERTVADVDAELMLISNYESEFNAYNKLKESYDNALKNREDVLEKISKVEAEINASERIAPVDPNEKVFLNQQWLKNYDAIADSKKLIETLTANNNHYSSTLESLDKPICPISKGLICTTDKTVVRNEIVALVKANEEAITKEKARLSTLNANGESIQNRLKEYERKESAYNNHASLYERLETLRNNIPTVPDEPIEPKKPEDLYARKKALNEERSRILKFESATKAQTDVERLDKAVKTHDELVKLLSPKSGIREQIMQIALEPLVEHCNKRAAELKLDFKVDLKIENGIRIMCSPRISKITEPLPLECVSSGEQAYALFLVMDALNALHGMGILMLDDLDKLDEVAFKSLLDLLTKEGVLDGYDHVFLSAVDHIDTINALKLFEGSLIDEIITLS